MPTIDDYRNGIRECFKSAPDKSKFGLSTSPVPTDFRRKALWLVDEELMAADRQILNRFFGINAGDDARRKIEDFQNHHYRPIQSLFTTSINSDDEAMLDLAALIVKFEPRPFWKFATGDNLAFRLNDVKPPNTGVPASSESKGVIKVEDSHVGDGKDGGKPDKEGEKKKKRKYPIIFIFSQEGRAQAGRWIQRNKLGLGVAVGVAALLTSVFYSSQIFAPAPFMQWQNDHYIRVGNEAQETPITPISKMDEQQFPMQRVRVYDTTTFFIKGRPRYWYVRDQGYLFFNRPGRYPLDRKRELKVVSTEIAKKIHDGTIKIDY